MAFKTLLNTLMNFFLNNEKGQEQKDKNGTFECLLQHMGMTMDWKNLSTCEG